MSPAPSLYIFADEAGDLTFSNVGSEYFLVCSVTMRSVNVAHRLIDLRHELTLEGFGAEHFHARNDPWPRRLRVLDVIRTADLTVDALLLHKRKTRPHIAAQTWYFYQLAWHLLFQFVAPHRCQATDDLLVAAAAITTIEKKSRFENALNSVVQQHNRCKSFATGFWQANTHPCLQVADYCAWAIQRWKEQGDRTAYDLIDPLVQSCYEPFDASTKTYY